MRTIMKESQKIRICASFSFPLIFIGFDSVDLPSIFPVGEKSFHFLIPLWRLLNSKGEYT